MAMIDSHQHYWEAGRSFRWQELPWVVGAVSYAWKQSGIDALDRDFLPDDLEPQAAEVGCDRTVMVQVLNNLGETHWMLDVADAHDSVAGVVGWVDLTQPAELVARDLEDLGKRPKLHAIRHLVEFEADDEWLLRPDGLGVLERMDVPYDLLLRPRHLTRVAPLSEKLPDLDMVIDHIAKPDIKGAVLDPWRADVKAAAKNPRIMCKLSGMVTEADHQGWKPDDLVPYVETVVEAFGTDRVMFGSDWPVSTLAGTYERVYSALRHALAVVLGGLDLCGRADGVPRQRPAVLQAELTQDRPAGRRCYP